MKLKEKLRVLSDKVEERIKFDREEVERKKKANFETILKNKINNIRENTKKLAGQGSRSFTVFKSANHHKEGAYSANVIVEYSDLAYFEQKIYDFLIEEGFEVLLEYWETTDYDEPGAYIGGWSMVIKW